MILERLPPDASFAAAPASAPVALGGVTPLRRLAMAAAAPVRAVVLAVLRIMPATGVSSRRRLWPREERRVVVGR